MENLKISLIDVLYDNKGKQSVVFMLNDLGYTTGFKSIDFYSYLYACSDSKGEIKNTIQFGNNGKTFANNKGREITIQELRDMVVLKRNDVSIERKKLNQSEINFRAANAYNKIKGDNAAQLTEDDVRLVLELIGLIKSHGEYYES